MKDITCNVELRKPNNGTNIKYPALMKSTSSDLTVLMTACSKGFVVYSNALYDVGNYSDTWEQSSFRPFDGELVLSNKTI